ncbi:uncharacterized protein GlcG (DUF336 family) [Rhizobium sp. BIGb0125]|uniref:GlcG/HbpS family heme-binding protein n=1 Tax=Rhizobium sp. BIGb0125 TaxID=2940618 RepID=UPI0021686606|nr:heme-binding protein [Rhizobium sp. BIGb0125]MCS4243801.1 uncharacterized protein GlcG (DUF336 family) [Rhizobium sp. BIGb0125]
MKRILLAATAAAVMTSAASAQVLEEKNISMELASTIAREAVAACSAEGYNVSAAVVDRAGVLRALLRADNAGSHTPEAARQKAYTSSSSRMPTSAMAENIAKNPTAAELASIDGFLVLAGGMPIKVGNATIGAIGVGGAPGGQFDEACAVAAISKVQAQLK